MKKIILMASLFFVGINFASAAKHTTFKGIAVIQPPVGPVPNLTVYCFPSSRTCLTVIGGTTRDTEEEIEVGQHVFLDVYNADEVVSESFGGELVEVDVEDDPSVTIIPD